MRPTWCEALTGAALVLVACSASAPRPLVAPAAIDPPVLGSGFLQPAPGPQAAPVWGVENGLQVGLWPTPGPRGVVRVYAPHLGLPDYRAVNALALEVVAEEAWASSQLERSDYDGAVGKRLWSVASLDAAEGPRTPWQPAPARLRPGVGELDFVLAVEPFRSGARPRLQVTLRRDRPFEVAFRIHPGPEGASLRSCGLSAVLPPGAQLRLRDGLVSVSDLWPDPARRVPGLGGFAGQRSWRAEFLAQRAGSLWLAAEPAGEGPAPRTVHYWRTAPDDAVRARVTTRGDLQRFSLEAPCDPERELVFGVEPLSLAAPAASDTP